MNAEIKAQWVDALRSGKYTQGEFSLRETTNGQTTHCCLGVLSELAAEAGVVNVEDDLVDEQANLLIAAFGPDRDAAFLPLLVQDWSGLTSANGYLGDQDVNGLISLTSLNDNEYTFEEIADIIEERF